MIHLTQTLLRPLISEKATNLTDRYNRYSFIVALKASKKQIKLAVEKLYHVDVLKVTTLITPGKLKRSAKSIKKLSKYKKAYLQIKKDQKIEFFKEI